MAIFNSPASPQKRENAPPPETPTPRAVETRPEPSFASPATAPAPATQRAPANQLKESVIASDLTIEGKIEGSGHVRLAGKFKGDVNVQGDLTIEVGAKLNGGVKARKVIIAGELEGNIDSAERVELLDSGAMIGDIKAGTVTVAAGSKMRGQVEFGWSGKDGKSNGSGNGKGAAGENGAGA
ncbi:bactofilin family protein [Marilutibacter chinensis]|uniref:Polymer-forming cytoskeletal protein n=1 Tax=Marilutibacter chinensis TaxID=2912247 RepID=A0ABS9HP77_9GAMM|nr:polymer-forming cytoskeletal protein [Lysobacter chinensis]MCF7220776.1 polymer-forming cytoskeletal protein [Lysobacter chinensis]